MNFISSEKFLSQSKEVQSELIQWWQPEVGDLIGIEREMIKLNFSVIKKYKEICVTSEDVFNYNSKNELLNSYYKRFDSNKLIPLLTEGQLISFIEEKTSTKISINIGDIGYQIVLYKFIEGDVDENNALDSYKEYNELGNDLLEALWKVTIDLASK